MIIITSMRVTIIESDSSSSLMKMAMLGNAQRYVCPFGILFHTLDPYTHTVAANVKTAAVEVSLYDWLQKR